jgi:flagella basal body P-ring formation protein FlgA
MVDAVVNEGMMMITIKALALEDGVPGQTIRMKNPKSGGEFRGKVQNEQTVEVTL